MLRLVAQSSILKVLPPHDPVNRAVYFLHFADELLKSYTISSCENFYVHHRFERVF